MELQIARATADVILVLVGHRPHFMIPTIEVMVTVSDREALLVHHHTLVLGDPPVLRPGHHVVAVVVEEEVVAVV